MAQKRAYDRAVFRHLGITGLLEENELPDEEEQDGMDRLSPDEAKQVAEWVNKIIGAKNKSDLKQVSQSLRTLSTQKVFNDLQLDVLRGLWTKKYATFEKSF